MLISKQQLPALFQIEEEKKEVSASDEKDYGADEEVDNSDVHSANYASHKE